MAHHADHLVPDAADLQLAAYGFRPLEDGEGERLIQHHHIGSLAQLGLANQPSFEQKAGIHIEPAHAHACERAAAAATRFRRKRLPIGKGADGRGRKVLRQRFALGFPGFDQAI